MSKTLYLPLNKKWYEMIERGEKTEEYREIKPYYVDRILNIKPDFNYATFKKFDAVRFSYGYTKRTMTFEVESITIGKGKPEWGAPAEDVFVIKLGRRLA